MSLKDRTQQQKLFEKSLYGIPSSLTSRHRDPDPLGYAIRRRRPPEQVKKLSSEWYLRAGNGALKEQEQKSPTAYRESVADPD